MADEALASSKLCPQSKDEVGLVEGPTCSWCSIGFRSFEEGCDVNAVMDEVLQLHEHVPLE